MLEDSPIDHEREQYLSAKRTAAMVVHRDHFMILCRKYIGGVPLLHAAAFRGEDGSEGIIIGYDQFQGGFGQDFTSLISYEIEHEAQELWLTRGQDSVDPYGPAHYEAIRQTLTRAHREGNLRAFLAMKQRQMETFAAYGETHAIEELNFYRTEAERIEITSKEVIPAPPTTEP